MQHHSIHNEVRQVPAISLREPVCRDRRENSFGHQTCPQERKLSEKGNREILGSGQMFSSPDAHPGYQRKGKDGVTQNAFGRAHLCGVQSEPSFDIGKKLFDGPAPGEALNQQERFEIQIGRRQVSGFAFAFAVPDDDDLKLDPGLRPPGDEGFVVEPHELAVNFDANPFPAPAGLSNGRKARKTASVFWFAAPFCPLPFGKRGSEHGIETQTAGQRDFHLGQGFEDGLIVVSPVGHQRNLEGNPGLDFLKRLDRYLESSTKFCFGTVLFGSVKGYPKRQSDRDSKQLDDYGQDNPVVPPDVTRSRPAGVIPEGAGAVDVFAPFGAQSIVDDHQKLRELKGLDDQKQQSFEKSFWPKLEMGEKTVEAGFVAVESRSVSKASDVALAGLNHPGNRGCTKIRPASFGKGQTKIQDYLGKVRCRVVSNHSPFSGCVELVSQPLASVNGLFFLSSLSRVNL